MVTTYPYVVFDVFTQTAFLGNALAIVHLPNPASLTRAQKQLIAREFNFSETVFIYPESSPACRAFDIFTRFYEIPFAGHPTIGTAQYVFQHLVPKDCTTYRLVCKAGNIDIEYDTTTGLARAEVPHNLRTHAQSVSIEDILVQHPELVPLKASLPTMCPVVSSVKGMTNVQIDVSAAPQALNVLKPARPPPGVVLDADFSPSPIGSNFYAKLDSGNPEVQSYHVRRMMVDGVEDSGTGSAAVGLAGFLSQEMEKPVTKTRYELAQGVEMGQRNDIFVDVEMDEAGKVAEKIYLSGHAVQIMEGKILGNH